MAERMTNIGKAVRAVPPVPPVLHDAPAQAFLAAARRVGPISTSARIVFGLDATMSRQPTWDTACGLQSAMFDAAAAVATLSVRLAYFRGGSEFRVFPFVTDAVSLRRTMERVSCRAGHTQIARLLRHVDQEHRRCPVACLIFVGDAVEEDAAELVRLAEAMRPVKAFMFHERGDNPDVEHVAATFRAIAKATGGACLNFDRDAPRELAGLLAAIAIYATGGMKALAQSETAGARLLLGHLRN